MEMVNCVLFDLDQTLVDSRSLEALRDSGKWDEALRRIHETRPIGEVLSTLKLLRDAAVLCGVVTSSPRDYALRILDYHKIQYDILIADEDTNSKKPNAEPILAAMERLSVVPNRGCFYIGDDLSDIETAQRAGIRSVLFACGRENQDFGKMAQVEHVASSLEDFVRLLGLITTRPSFERPLPVVEATDSLTKAVASFLEGNSLFAWLSEVLVPLLPEHSYLYVVGGSVRDAFLHVLHNKPYQPKDIDIVITSIFDGDSSYSSLRNICADQLQITRTNFDAVGLDLLDIRAEIWCLENSFQIRLFNLSPSIHSFLQYVVFNANAVALDVKLSQTLVSRGFMCDVKNNAVSLNTPRLYFPALQIARLFLLMKEAGMVGIPTCQKEVFSQHREYYVPYYKRYLEYKNRSELFSELLREVASYGSGHIRL